jgi:DNA-binding response OmpR family regulator
LDFLKDIRQSGSAVPIVILTARTDEESVVRGLHIGADDYVRKPFGNRELLARMETAARKPLPGGNRISFDHLVIQVDQRKAFFDGQDLDLKRREFDLMQYLVEHAEAVVTRDSLLDRFDAEGEIFDRTIDSHVSHLRSKLRQAGAQGIRITSVYGIGYRLERE